MQIGSRPVVADLAKNQRANLFGSHPSLAESGESGLRALDEGTAVAPSGTRRFPGESRDEAAKLGTGSARTVRLQSLVIRRGDPWARSARLRRETHSRRRPLVRPVEGTLGEHLARLRVSSDPHGPESAARGESCAASCSPGTRGPSKTARSKSSVQSAGRVPSKFGPCWRISTTTSCALPFNVVAQGRLTATDRSGREGSELSSVRLQRPCHESVAVPLRTAVRRSMFCSFAEPALCLTASAVSTSSKTCSQVKCVPSPSGVSSIVSLKSGGQA